MVLEIDELVKEYRRGVRANDGVSLSVGAGEVYGLLGHNGAGKTTLVNQVVGLLRPTSGRITLDDRDAVADPAFARRACSIQPQSQVPINGLTPRQAIELVGRMRGGRPDVVRARSDGLVGSLDLGEWLDTDGARLSGGVKRLVSFCMAAVVPGRLVVLDEPTNDVDPVRRRLLWAAVRSLADEGAAVLLVTHNVVEAERSVDRLAILDHGRVLREGSPAALKDDVDDELRLEVILEPGRPVPVLPTLATATSLEGQRLRATIHRDRAAEAIAWASDARLAGAIEEFAVAPATLEDVYVDLVAGTEPGRQPVPDTTLAHSQEAFDVVRA